LEDGESQDLLNVDIIPGGKGVKKRDGYGLHKTVGISTSAIHGGHYFQDTSGSDIQLWGGDVYLNASVNGAATVQIATGTLAATWQCTDNSGYAYCVTSSRNTPVRTSGTTATTTYQTGIPLGTMITNTPDRLLVAGVSGAESTLYFSQANTFTNFTTGINSADPFTEVINSPGSRITHIRYACGKVLWWKDGSFGYSLGSDQFNLENVTVSQNIGTLDNSSDEYNGIVYFRGQDNHIYQYDCSNVTRLSRKITPTVEGSGRRKANSWTQTSQTDFDSGVGILSGSFSTSLSPGDVVLSSFTATDTITADFAQGTLTNTTAYAGIGVRLSTSPGNLPNNSMETANVGDVLSDWGAYLFTRYDGDGSIGGSACGTSWSDFVGTNFAYSLAGQSPSASPKIVTTIYELLSGTTLYTDTINMSGTADCSFSTRTITVSASDVGKRVQLVFISSDTSPSSDIAVLRTTNSFVLSGDISYMYAWDTNGGNPYAAIDWVTGGSNTINSGQFTSRVFNTGVTSAMVYTSANWTVNTSTPYLEVQTSANGSSGWTKVTSSTGTNVSTNQYIRYLSSFTVGSSDNALSTLDDVSFVAKSTGGVYLSAVNNASGVTEWSTFGANDQTGGGTIVYSVRASTQQFTIQSSTPLWATQDKNATVNYATGTYMQMRGAFTTTSATQAFALNDFSFNWFEGNAVDKAYIKYWNDYVWVAVSSGTAGLNNRIQRWDILNQTWLLDDISANGFLVDNNNLYFGSSSVGKIFKYGSGLTTDDSSDINSYWRSKDFTGADPFVQNTWDQLDFIVKRSSGTFLAVDYRVNGSSVTNTYSINLYDPVKTILHRGNNLPGKNGTFFNVQFGDNSSNPRYEVLGLRARYTPLGWRPE